MKTQIHADLSTQLKPGMIVTGQLGNPFDSYWYPAAPVLLLHTTVTFFGDIQFNGLYKDSEGWHIAEMVTTHNTRDRFVNETGMDVGITYCTCSKPFDMDKQECMYFTAEQNKTIQQALRFHREQVAALPEAERYVKLQPELPPTSLKKRAVIAAAIQTAVEAGIPVYNLTLSRSQASRDPSSPAFLAGHVAFHANKGRDANPHPEGDVAHDQWNNGYDNDNDL